MNRRIHRHLSRGEEEAASAVFTHDKLDAAAKKPAEMAWRDYLIMLLHIAAEIEHALMVEYLYAAYSLGGDDLTADQQKAVTEWRDIILSIAREEMGHLLTVQNLLCLLGGPITFEREDIPFDNDFYPFPFKLEPLTIKSLSFYVFAEMPRPRAFDRAKASASDTMLFEVENEDVPHIAKAVANLVKKHKARPVGEVYEWIIEIVSNPDWIADSDFRAENYCYQACWDDWGRGYGNTPTAPAGLQQKLHTHPSHLIIERMATRTEAIAALKAVAGQGEAPHLNPEERRDKSELSHFDRFLKVYQGMERVRGWTPTRRAPVNPTTLAAGYKSGSTPITHEASKQWASLFNIRYRMLLTYLAHSFRLARTAPGKSPGVRGATMHKVFGEMYNLKTIAGILVRMPLNDKGGVERAGPPFEMPYSMELPAGEADAWRLHNDIISSARAVCESLLRDAKKFAKVTPPEGTEYLKTLLSLDRQSSEWIQNILKNERLERREGI